jgi:hypothetical protein
MKLNVLCIGDIVGRPGRWVLADKLKGCLSAQKETPFAGRKPGDAISGGVPLFFILYVISAFLSSIFSGFFYA